MSQKRRSTEVIGHSLSWVRHVPHTNSMAVPLPGTSKRHNYVCRHTFLLFPFMWSQQRPTYYNSHFSVCSSLKKPCKRCVGASFQDQGITLQWHMLVSLLFWFLVQQCWQRLVMLSYQQRISHNLKKAGSGLWGCGAALVSSNLNRLLTLYVLWDRKWKHSWQSFVRCRLKFPYAAAGSTYGHSHLGIMEAVSTRGCVRISALCVPFRRVSWTVAVAVVFGNISLFLKGHSRMEGFQDLHFFH